MPAAPSSGGRDEQLLPPSHTVYEFTGAAADDGPAGSKHTFIGSANLELGDAAEQRSSNLSSGGLTWMLVGVAVLVGGGLLAFMLMRGSSTASAQDGEAPEQAVAAAAEGEGKEEAAEGESKEEAKAEAGEEAKADDGEEAKAEDEKAEEAKAEDEKAEDAKADEPKPDAPKEEPNEEPKADPPKEEPKPSGGSTKKSSGGSSSKKKSSTKKRKTLKPSKPPRDPLKNLPAPPS